MNVSPDSIRLVGETDLLELARVARGTWNGWDRGRHVETSDTGLYDEQAVIYVAVLNLLSDALTISKAAIVWKTCEQDLVEACLAFSLDGEAPDLDLIVDLQTLEGFVATGVRELFDATHRPVPSPRGRIVLPLGAIVMEARQGFWRRAKPAAEFAKDRRRKPAARSYAKQRPDSRGG